MVKDYFKLAEKGTSLRVEVVAGVTTFLTMWVIAGLSLIFLTMDRLGDIIGII